MSKVVFQRKPLDQICSVPKDIIDVYVVEHHIWSGGGSPEAKQARSDGGVDLLCVVTPNEGSSKGSVSAG